MMIRFVGLLGATSVLTLVLAGCGGDSFEPALGGDSGADAGPETSSETGSDVSETSTGALQINPSNHVFTNVTPGTESDTFPFTVTNTGQEATGTISVTTNHETFVVQDDCTTLAPSETCTVEVGFNPIDSEPIDAILTVSANPGGTSTATLRGETGVVQEGIAIEPAAYDFGPVATGDTADAPFVVRNTGSAALPAVAIQLDFDGTPVFSVLHNDCGGGLEPSQACDVTVRYAPIESEPGKKSATLVASSGNSNGNALLSGHTTDVFVRMNGVDTNDGLSMATAFATITRALEVAQPGWTVLVAHGDFGAAEEFPIRIQNVRLVGVDQPTITAPESPPAHIIEMTGEYPELHGVLIDVPHGSGEQNPAIIAAQPTIWATIGATRITMGAAWTGLETDVEQAAHVEVFDFQVECTSTNSATRGIAVIGASQGIFDGLTLSGCRVGFEMDGVTTAFVRNSNFLGIPTDAVRIVSSDADLDMGLWTGSPVTSVSGNNRFEGSGQNFTALNVLGQTIVHAHGNTWLPNVQGADAAGQYAGDDEEHGPVNPMGAANFRLASSTSWVMF